MDCNDASGIYSIHAVFACISVVNHDLFKNTQLLEVNYNVLIIIAKYCQFYYSFTFHFDSFLGCSVGESIKMSAPSA